MKLASKYLGLLVMVLLVVPFAYAATVTGTVKGPDGASYRGAFVQAQNSNTKILVSVLTDKDGPVPDRQFAARPVSAPGEGGRLSNRSAPGSDPGG